MYKIIIIFIFFSASFCSNSSSEKDNNATESSSPNDEDPVLSKTSSEIIPSSTTNTPNDSEIPSSATNTPNDSEIPSSATNTSNDSKISSSATNTSNDSKISSSASPTSQQTTEPKNLVDTDDEGSTDEVDSNETQDSGVEDSATNTEKQYSIDEFKQILHGLSGLYMKDLIDNNALKKMKIEFIFSEQNNSFDIRLAYNKYLENKHQICSSYSIDELIENEILSINQNTEVSVWEPGEWSVTIDWPDNMDLHISPDNIYHDEPYILKIEEMTLTINKIRKFFRPNVELGRDSELTTIEILKKFFRPLHVFTVESVHITASPKPEFNIKEWGFFHKEFAYEHYDSIECL